MPADARINGFFLTTGATFAAFASGFGVCLFDLDTVGSCLEVSHHWVDIFHSMGDHILAWGEAIMRGAFR
jgi:hypothetical protein